MPITSMAWSRRPYVHERELNHRHFNCCDDAYVTCIIVPLKQSVTTSSERAC